MSILEINSVSKSYMNNSKNEKVVLENIIVKLPNNGMGTIFGKSA